MITHLFFFISAEYLAIRSILFATVASSESSFQGLVRFFGNYFLDRFNVEHLAQHLVYENVPSDEEA